MFQFSRKGNTKFVIFRCGATFFQPKFLTSPTPHTNFWIRFAPVFIGIFPYACVT